MVLHDGQTVCGVFSNRFFAYEILDHHPQLVSSWFSPYRYQDTQSPSPAAYRRGPLLHLPPRSRLRRASNGVQGLRLPSLEHSLRYPRAFSPFLRRL